MDAALSGFDMKRLDNIGKVLDAIGFGSIFAVFLILIAGAIEF
jgi:hypothetical protein